MSHEDRNVKLQRVIAEYARNAAAGQVTSVEEFIRQYPDLADELREQLAPDTAPPADDLLLAPTAVRTGDNDGGTGVAEDDEAATVAPTEAALPRDPAPSSATVSSIVDGYRLLRLLGEGGMGQVWEAESVDTGRRVAIKLLSSSLTPSAETLDRFIREAQLAASLSHPRSTFVFGAGEHQGQPYIVMELMPGATLQDVVAEEGPLPVNRAVDYVLDVIDGLEAAHRLGIIHRDVKPSNCFVDSDGRIKVGDFGLSKSLVVDANLTRTGVFMGTPQYAAPEQVRGAEVDERTDIYAVGATLYSIIANRHPFSGDAVAVIAQIVSETPEPLVDIVPNVPQALSRIVARTLEREPDRRFANLADLRSALLPFATGGTTRADIWRRFAAYCIDSATMSLVTLFCAMTTSAIHGLFIGPPVRPGEVSQIPQSTQQILQLVALVLAVSYFGIAESRWGRGIGKLLMGLSVVGADGEQPKLWQAYLRAFVVPGMLGLGFLGQYLLRPTSSDEIQVIQQSTVIPLAAWLFQTSFLLVCVSTMRARNGYRGVHEWISGTRVVRLKSTTQASHIDIPVVAPTRVDGVQQFGPFEVAGLLGKQGECQVFLTKDTTLGRTAWVYASEQAGASPSIQRQRIARAARPYWLQGGQTNGTQWNAFEPAIGCPLPYFLEHSQLDWTIARQVLEDLAEELAAGVEDGSLPFLVGPEQIWIVRDGRVKLLDEPLQASQATEPASPTPSVAPAEQAAAVLRRVTSDFTQGHILPDHVERFLQEFSERPNNEETIRWASEQLRSFSDRITDLDWSHRLGCIAASAGLESPMYMFVAMAIPPLIWVAAQPAHLIWCITSLVVAAGIPLAVGVRFRGSPVFNLMGISIRRAKGGPAERLRCGFRTMISWVPITSLGTMFGFFITSWISPSLSETEPPSQTLVLIGILSQAFLLLVFAGGVIYSGVSPRRAIQDLLSGTRLVVR